MGKSSSGQLPTWQYKCHESNVKPAWGKKQTWNWLKVNFVTFINKDINQGKSEEEIDLFKLTINYFHRRSSGCTTQQGDNLFVFVSSSYRSLPAHSGINVNVESIFRLKLETEVNAKQNVEKDSQECFLSGCLPRLSPTSTKSFLQV